MTTHRKQDATGHRSLKLTLVAALVATGVGCGSGTRFSLAVQSSSDAASSAEGDDDAAATKPKPPPDFIVIADTQYSIPVTDYEIRYRLGGELLVVPPSIASTKIGSFYRHLVANQALPLALTHIINQERESAASAGDADGMFGMFAGDLVEFSCLDEATEMFRSLERANLPFIVALGNHDVIFHGAYDTDGLQKNAEGAWDVYVQSMWTHVCSKLGGPLSKSRFIVATLDYYESKWGFPIKQKVGRAAGAEPFPVGQPFGATVDGPRGWTLEFEARLAEPEDPRSHRKSYLWQRFKRRDSAAHGAVDVTVLDTTDYSSRRALCDQRGMILQAGMSGALSADQIEWIAERPPKGDAHHFVLTHYLPFRDITFDGRPVDECELTAGSSCSWANQVAPLFADTATFVYAHVHRPFQLETLKDEREGVSYRLVRTPSLVDNKSYVRFSRGSFAVRELLSVPADSATAFETGRPFATLKNTCEQRHQEYVELVRNTDCFLARRHLPAGSPKACVRLSSALAQHKNERVQLCRADAAAWLAARPETLFDRCRGWEPASDRFRCVLRELSSDVFEQAKAAGLSDADLPKLATELLSKVETKAAE